MIGPAFIYKYLVLFLHARIAGLSIEMRRGNEKFAFAGACTRMDEQTTTPFFGD